MRKVLFHYIILFSTVCAAQTDADYFSRRFLKYRNEIYVDNIKTVLLERLGEPLSDPIIRLNSGEQLLFQFDLLDNEIQDFSYRMIHCDPEWKSSELSENEFLDGFNTDQIIDYKHSLNTLQDYWHYQLIFPNAQMKPLLSGNYLLVVFPNDQPDSIVISQRFLVVDQKIQINGNAHRATLIEKRNSHQEIDFKLNVKGIPIANPYQDLKIVLLQNFNYNTANTQLVPQFASNDDIDFNLEEGNVFEGGSEYRILDLRTNKFLTQSIERIDRDSLTGAMLTVLKPDLRLNTQRYSANEDINGKYLIKIYEGRDAHLEGDYVYVKFRLKASEEDPQKTIYLEGNFTGNRLTSDFRMEYKAASGFFEKVLYMKQGYYNYRYVSEDDNLTCTVLETEGSHYETRNEYDILVYWKEIGGRYYKLIGNLKVQAGGF